MSAPRSSPMPPWLKNHLVAQGTMDDAGMTWKAKVRSCKKCKLPCIGGLPRMMLPGRYCDPLQLSAYGELQANLAGRDTFELWPSGGVSAWGNLQGDLELIHRSMHGDSSVRTKVPREDNWIAILVEHNCNLPTPMSWAIHRPPVVMPAEMVRSAANWPGIPSLENWIEFGF